MQDCKRFAIFDFNIFFLATGLYKMNCLLSGNENLNNNAVGCMLYTHTNTHTKQGQNGQNTSNETKEFLAVK